MYCVLGSGGTSSGVRPCLTAPGMPSRAALLIPSHPPRNLLEACPTPEEAWLLAGAWPASGSIALAAAVDCCGSSAWSVICTGTQVSPGLFTSDGCFTK